MRTYQKPGRGEPVDAAVANRSAAAAKIAPGSGVVEARAAADTPRTPATTTSSSPSVPLVAPGLRRCGQADGQPARGQHAGCGARRSVSCQVAKDASEQLQHERNGDQNETGLEGLVRSRPVQFDAALRKRRDRRA
jgi:hypothetical protein